MDDGFYPAQRWISESEPELGLGTILRVSDRTVSVIFKASDEKREYARRNAPLRRVRFRAGDAIRTNNDAAPVIVQKVVDRAGLIFYTAGGREFCETELSDTISFNNPEERLFAGQLDRSETFDLRIAAIKHQHRFRKSSVRGFVGGRINLIPHQLYVASEVASRLAPRVLLADEVGLGKTIEACLILHRLMLTGRLQRALILVPPSLIHQWFVELLRRFNLWFSIFDEERCEAIESRSPDENPFLDSQLVVCEVSMFTSNPRRVEQALSVKWDVLVVDEAHHLAWSPDGPSPEYSFVESLSRKTPGLLLLTATPDQLGVASHFARLRLLDPDRFFDLKEFIRETEQYRDVARRAESLAGSDELDALLDQHGPGRVTFRNTRATISGFPNRIVQLAPLEVVAHHAREFDVLVEWLVGLLRTLSPAKVVLICRTQSKVVALEAALRQQSRSLKVAVFHEGLSLVQRDRNAAWFAEEHGANVLLCSEIGSEGRNFQFAHHLVLFDLPFDPELVEQRIGRLDRIGQTSDIYIHAPHLTDSAHEVLVLWHHEGLNAFEKNLTGGRELFERFGARVHSVAAKSPRRRNGVRDELTQLIRETQVAREDISLQLHEGRDRLLELSSFRPKAAADLIAEIRRQDDDASLDDFMLSIFDQYSINVEQLAPRTYKVGSAGVLAESFPGLPADGFSVTCRRQMALAREDIQFLTWDHPLVTGALDLLLGSEKGNSSFALWPDPKKSALYVEAIYLLECVAPPHLHVDRFLPPTPLRVIVDQDGEDQGMSVSESILAERLKNSDPVFLVDQPELRDELLPTLIRRTRDIANSQAPKVVSAARAEMAAQLEHEINRLRELQKVNRSVRDDEIDLLVGQQRELDERLMDARLRLDAVRLIQRG